MGKNELIIFIILVNVLVICLITGIIIFLYQYRKRKIFHEKEKKELQQQYQLNILTVQVESQQQVMQHIGREIHDNVGQKLTLASIYSKQHSENHAPSATIAKLIDESLEELRQLSKSLTNPEIISHSLLDLLYKEAERINNSGTCLVTINDGNSAFQLSPDQKNSLFRLLQEFIQNSLKHAQCQTIDISFFSDEGKLFVIATDDGVGFDADQHSNGSGLHNMRRRAEELSADFNLISQPAKGTEINITLPIS